jgi:hypothetical protein
MQNFYIVDLARYLPKSSPRWLFDLEKFLGGINDDRISLSNYPKTFVDTIVNRQASGDPDTAAFMAATMLYGRVAAKSGLRQMVVSMGLILGLISAAVAEAELPEVFARVANSRLASPVAAFVELFMALQAQRDAQKDPEGNQNRRPF